MGHYMVTLAKIIDLLNMQSDDFKQLISDVLAIQKALGRYQILLERLRFWRAFKK